VIFSLGVFGGGGGGGGPRAPRGGGGGGHFIGFGPLKASGTYS
jgi:hypothetical protein